MDESEKSKSDLKSKIDLTLEELKTADDAEMRDHLEKLEKANLSLSHQNEQIKGQLAEAEVKLAAALESEKKTKLKDKVKLTSFLDDGSSVLLILVGTVYRKKAF